MIAFGVIDEESEDGQDMLGRPMEEYLNMRVDTFDVQFEDYAVEQPDIHPCTEEELANFFPRNKVASIYWDQALPLMYCIDPSKFKIRGDSYSQTSFANFRLTFNIPEEKCRENEYDLECVTTREFFETVENKRIFTFRNRVRFNAEGYGEGAHIIKETVLQQYEFPKTATQKNYLVREDILEREDSLFMHISNLTGETDTFFDVIEDDSGATLPDWDTRLELVFRMS